MSLSEAVGRFFRAVDERDWSTVRALMADELALDYTSVFGGEPETVRADEVVARWRGLLPGFDATQHFLGPLIGEAEVADEGTVECNVRGYHHLDGETWMVAGWYLLTVRRSPWRVAGVVLRASYETGDRGLVARAQDRAAGA